MPTTKKRVNITLPLDTEYILNTISKRDNVPVSTKVLELVEIALEIEEDLYFSNKALERMKKGNPLIPHEQAWK